jgi:Putative Ig domain
MTFFKNKFLIFCGLMITVFYFNSCSEYYSLNIKTSSLPDGMVNQNYDFLLEGKGDCSDDIWFVRNGSLPPGLSLSLDGRISGTPVVPGNFSFRIRSIKINCDINEKIL